MNLNRVCRELPTRRVLFLVDWRAEFYTVEFFWRLDIPKGDCSICFFILLNLFRFERYQGLKGFNNFVVSDIM